MIDCFALAYAVKGFYDASLAMVVSPNKGETAVCGCYCTRVMAMRMCEVLARLWVGVRVLLALIVHYLQGNFCLCNRIKFNVFFINFSKQIQQRTCIGKIFARWRLAIAITSLNITRNTFIVKTSQSCNGYIYIYIYRFVYIYIYIYNIVI